MKFIDVVPRRVPGVRAKEGGVIIRRGCRRPVPQNQDWAGRRQHSGLSPRSEARP
jgi:hypothetical protein